MLQVSCSYRLSWEIQIQQPCIIWLRNTMHRYFFLDNAKWKVVKKDQIEVNKKRCLARDVVPWRLEIRLWGNMYRAGMRGLWSLDKHSNYSEVADSVCTQTITHTNQMLLVTYTYSISQKWVHPSHFCKYLSISSHVTTLKKWHFATM